MTTGATTVIESTPIVKAPVAENAPTPVMPPLDHDALNVVKEAAGDGSVGDSAANLLQNLPETPPEIPAHEAAVTSPAGVSAEGNAEPASVAVPASETPMSAESVQRPDLLADETAYLTSNQYNPDTDKGYKGLDERYADKRTGAEYVMSQLDATAARLGIAPIPDDFSARPEVVSNPQGALEALAREQIGKAFSTEFAQEGQVPTPEQQKAESVRHMSELYIDRAFKALANGEMGKLTDAQFAQQMARMVRENVLKLSYQDYIAAENTLGDHGVRHLVDHNITVTQQLADQLEANGQTVSASDRLMMYQIMIDHDMGYAMRPVRDEVNGYSVDDDNPDAEVPPEKRGKPNLSADRGHNVLAAKFLRERAAMPNDALGQLFTPDQLATMHAGILTHDASTVDFQIGAETPEAHRENIMSAIHLADNTHAFETKLPEVLFATPEGIKTMLLMKIASESGLGGEAVEGIKNQMREQIATHTEWSGRYKTSLNRALDTLGVDSYKFTVPRIFGTNPEFTIDSSGKVNVQVEEQTAHRDVMRTFGQDALKQAMKFMRDISGKEVSPGDTSVDSDRLRIVLKVGQEKSVQESAYQESLHQVLNTDPLRLFLFSYEGIAHDRELYQREHPDDAAGLGAINDRARQLFVVYQQAEAAVAARATAQQGRTAA